MGGEKLWGLWTASLTRGSPPRGRGKDSVMHGLQGVHGITPAWAGKSLSPTQRRTERGDHPRVGGEKLGFLAFLTREIGSPPRGRGKGPALHCSSPVPGITPAWAGKSDYSLMTNYTFKDHPRVGGEKI